MSWNDCLYCDTEGSMKPIEKTRVAKHNPEITEVAHQCDSCTRHADSYLWVPDGKAPTPKFEAVYGDYIPEYDAEYNLGLASAQAASIPKTIGSDHGSCDVSLSIIAVGVLALFFVAAVGAVIVGF